MTPETWRPVAGCPGYEVSDRGRVLSDKGRSPRFIRGTVNRGGYCTVFLRVDGGQVARLLHGLVAEAFIGPRAEGMEVRHLDGDPLNNAAENLTYGTHAENMQDRVRHGRHPMLNKTACVQGHEFDESNTRFDARGYRNCRTCARLATRALRSRRAAASAAA